MYFSKYQLNIYLQVFPVFSLAKNDQSKLTKIKDLTTFENRSLQKSNILWPAKFIISRFRKLSFP